MLNRPLRFEPLEDRRMLAVITVDSLADNTISDGFTTLREAIQQANVNVNQDTIEFASALFNAGPQNLILTKGLLEIKGEIILHGPGSAILTIDASGNDVTPDTVDYQGTGVFRIRDAGFFDAPATLRGLTLKGGDTNLRGGAIWSEEPLTVEDSVLLDNHSSQNGGGIYAEKRLDLIRTVVSQNSGMFGAGVYAVNTVVMTNSSLVDNQSRFKGGGLYTSGSTLSITNGEFIRNKSGDFEDGGGVYAVNANAVLHNTIFSLNSAGGSGGGYYLQGGRLTVNNGIFNDNGALVASGGGIFAMSALNVTLNSSLINENHASVNGGGLFANFMTAVNVNQSTFSGNGAESTGGGLYARNTVSLLIDDSDFSNNAAGSAGGGLMLDRQSGLSLIDSTFRGNSADIGGGLLIDDATTSILTSTFEDNRAIVGGGLAARNTNRINASHSTFSGNIVTDSGGAIWTSGVDVSLSYSTITHNRADSDTDGVGAGGGIYAFDGSAVSVSHTIIAQNLDAGFGPDVRLFPSFDPPTLFMFYSLLGTNLGNNKTETSPGVADALGNLIGGATNGPLDPQLGPLQNNGGPTFTHAPLPGSPVIDAGDPAAMAGMNNVPLTDQRGGLFTRVYGGRIDIGAVEVQPLHADFDSDGDVDGRDFLIWQRGVDTPNALPGDGDADGDMDVDGEDLAAWRNEYGAESGVALSVESLRSEIYSQPSTLHTHPSPYWLALPESPMGRSEVASESAEVSEVGVTDRVFTELGSLPQKSEDDFGDIAIRRAEESFAVEKEFVENDWGS